MQGMLDTLLNMLGAIAQFEHSMKAVRAGKVDVVLCYNLDRLGRNESLTRFPEARYHAGAGNVEQMEMVLLKARAWHPRAPLIFFKLACCASGQGA